MRTAFTGNLAKVVFVNCRFVFFVVVFLSIGTGTGIVLKVPV